MRSTLYDVLGVSEDASSEEIAVAYEVKQDALHEASGPDSQAGLKLLQEAHAILSDPVDRMKYDQRLKAEAAKNNRAVYYEEARGGSGWLVKTLALVALGAGGYFAYQHYEQGKLAAPASIAVAAPSSAPHVDPVAQATEAKATLLGDDAPAPAANAPAAPTSTPPSPPTAPAPADINDVNAVPLPAPAMQRPAYLSFLAHASPRAFLICNNGSVSSITGDQASVERQVAALGPGCTPYAINDQVVWAKAQ